MNTTLCDAFEVSPSAKAVEGSEGPLLRSYPGSAVEMANQAFEDEGFQFSLANFLCRPDAVNLHPPPPSSAHPQYINILLDRILQSDDCTYDVLRVTTLAGILRNRAADARRITKHVRDEVGGWGKHRWRRSSLWLLIRVVIQVSVDRAAYKKFILFFTCTLARDEGNINLSSDHLHLISSTIFRRLSKLGSSLPDWLSEKAMKTCSFLREVLDTRLTELQDHPYLFRNPSREQLTADAQLSLLNSGEYIRGALENLDRKPIGTSFRPFLPRGTIKDLLSSDGTLFDEAYNADPGLALHDVERLVEQNIDDWLACVTNADEACSQLGNLMERYMAKAHDALKRDPEDHSIALLTGIELYVAIDKIAVKEIPMLADYPPEIPVTFLEKLLLRTRSSLHRLSRAYQYLSARNSQSRPGWSVLSNEFTEESLPVRYYNQSQHLQQLKAHIEEDAMVVAPACLRCGGAALWGTHDEHQKHPPEQSPAEGLKISQSPLPASPLYAKVVVFELQCPTCIHIWRSAAPRILHGFYEYVFRDGLLAEQADHLLASIPALRPYLVERQGAPLWVQIRFAYFYPEGSQSWNNPILRYVVHWHPDENEDRPSIWSNRVYQLEDYQISFRLIWGIGGVGRYVHHTSHFSNDVSAAQVNCPPDLSLDEFIAFAHLRSCGSLQWLNILHGLRSRTLNFRHRQIHYLLAHSAFQVGPLDLNTGTWIWHKELQESPFHNAILDELESLFLDVGGGAIDGLLMSTISLLLTRVLASSPCEDVSERIITLLRRVRRKTFGWVQELSYDLTKAPANKERKILLLAMAATCRSTFDADPIILHKLFRSAEDIDALLTCAFFIHTFSECKSNCLLGTIFGLSPTSDTIPSDYYSRLLRNRDYHLSLALEGTLSDSILADPSDYGIDLAVAKIFFCHQPGTQRWRQLQKPNTCWFACSTRATKDRPLQAVHINQLNGLLQVDDQTLGGLPPKIGNLPGVQKILGDVCKCRNF